MTDEVAVVVVGGSRVGMSVASAVMAQKIKQLFPDSAVIPDSKVKPYSDYVLLTAERLAIDAIMVQPYRQDRPKQYWKSRIERRLGR